MKYLLSFDPFAHLPERVKKAYFAEDLHLLPFPGSLLFWGVPGYLQMQSEWPMANQIPLLHLVKRHEAPYGLRVPQSGWIHVPRPDHLSPHEDFGPIRNTFKRTHRWARVHRYEDELAIRGREEHLLHVLFSTAPKTWIYMENPWPATARSGPRISAYCSTAPMPPEKEIHSAIRAIEQGGLFGYRFQYPPMAVGPHQVYWHRPLVAYLSTATQKPTLLPDSPLGYLTAYDARNSDLARPLELWPRLL